MHSSSDKDQLIDALCLTAEAMGRVITPSAAMMMAEDLADYPMAVIGRALRTVRREAKGPLTVADIIQRCEAEDGRPGKDEAWSIGLDSSDEYGSAVMTQEIQLAMVSARILLDEGDQVGARMAFISTYERLVREARQVVTPVKWIVSLGHDKQRRVTAIQQAVQLKRLTAEDADRYVTGLGLEAPSRTGQAIAGLLTGKIVAPAPEAREKLAAMKEALAKTREEEAAMTPEEKRLAHEKKLQAHLDSLKGLDS